jgi:hypothetical protein
MMDQVDKEIAAHALTLWEEFPFLQPTAGRYKLVRCDCRWCWHYGPFRSEISLSEAEEVISGKMMAALARMWAKISIEQIDESETILFSILCSNEHSSKRGWGKSPSLAMFDVWSSSKP